MLVLCCHVALTVRSYCFVWILHLLFCVWFFLYLRTYDRRWEHTKPDFTWVTPKLCSYYLDKYLSFHSFDGFRGTSSTFVYRTSKQKLSNDWANLKCWTTQIITSLFVILCIAPASLFRLFLGEIAMVHVTQDGWSIEGIENGHNGHTARSCQGHGILCGGTPRSRSC